MPWRVVGSSDITATVHPACHYYKLVQEDAIYDPDLYGGERTATVSALVKALGDRMKAYEAALDRMSREISSVTKSSETEAVKQIEQNLAKSPRRGARNGEAEGEDAKDAKAA